MRSTYRVLAYLIAAEVVVQASVIAYGMFGVAKLVDGGGTLDQASMDGESVSFTGLYGFGIHGVNGQMVIPLLALVFLAVSFFAKVPGGVRWAAVVLALVVLEVLLGMLGHDVLPLGLLHGMNALFLFAAAVIAGRRASLVGATRGPASPERSTP